MSIETYGRYQLLKRLATGGMAQIYLARAETELGATRLAVVKEILPAFAADPRFAEMLTHEAKLAARLNHKHIAQVFDLGREAGHLFIAMEYVEGFDLNALLRQCTEKKIGLPAKHALGIVADVLEGLDYAHRREDELGVPLGIVHRDISPSNILISYEGEVKLCDFGIAAANDLVKDGASEALKGKAGYMSPEHARGEPLDARGDVFAAGIILWELLAGRRLYKPRSETPLLEQARLAEIPALPDKGLPNHDRLEAIVKKALARDPADRYSSAGTFLRALEEYLASAGLLASRLKLGEWMSSTLGTSILEQRRASERKLPKSSAPPPRSSERMKASIPAPPSVPADLASSVEKAEPPPTPPSPRTAALLAKEQLFPSSQGAIQAFKKELEKPVINIEPESLAGAAVDLASIAPPSSRSQLVGEKPKKPAVWVYVLACIVVSLLVALVRLIVQ